MPTMVRLCLYVGIGMAGGWLGLRMRIPGGTLIAAMLAVTVFKLLSHSSMPLPGAFRFFTQVMIGIMIGMTFQPEMVQHIRSLAIPIVFSAAALVCSGLFITVVLAKLGLVDITTGYLGTSPGGMAGLVGLAADTDANLPLVMTFHTFRLFLVIVTVPLVLFFLEWWLKR